MPKTLIVDLHIPAEQYLRHYQGSVKQVICTSRDGRKVQFPTGVLQRFVTHDGISGSFRLEIDDNNKLVSISRIR
ncbi:MAG: DUF2835 domain-containing protein [Pseudohongiella sp.]|nr:DUF2835 domain-containing protein [Pseudohongiella sp.]MDP2126121.1 DUF2835 domain-containing protein [Pseudohongiella sp.]